MQYSLCPVPVASHLAVELGWLDEEFGRAGVELSHLHASAEGGRWSAHFDHGLTHLIRDGGNIPAIWARADRAATKLVGLTAGPSGGQVLVRAASGLRRVADLAGRKIALSRHTETDRIDTCRATADRGLGLALALGGLERGDIEWIEVTQPDDLPCGRAARPADLWASRFQESEFVYSPEVRALRAGRVDAIYAQPPRTAALVATGEFTVLEDLDRHPDWTLRLANSPYAITVDAAFAESNPEAVVAFLRASIRAALWARSHRAQAAAIFERVALIPGADAFAQAVVSSDLVPNLSAQNLAGLELVQEFLTKRGYVKGSFDVPTWADPRYLAEALASF